MDSNVLEEFAVSIFGVSPEDHNLNSTMRNSNCTMLCSATPFSSAYMNVEINFDTLKLDRGIQCLCKAYAVSERNVVKACGFPHSFKGNAYTVP